jgi:hypothetical protein
VKPLPRLLPAGSARLSFEDLAFALNLRERTTLENIALRLGVSRRAVVMGLRSIGVEP